MSLSTSATGDGWEREVLPPTTVSSSSLLGEGLRGVVLPLRPLVVSTTASLTSSIKGDWD